MRRGEKVGLKPLLRDKKWISEYLEIKKEISKKPCFRGTEVNLKFANF